MAKQLIDGVQVKQLKVIPDERGRLMEMLRSDDELVYKIRAGVYDDGISGCCKGLALS